MSAHRNTQQSQFIISAVRPAQYPAEQGVEVALVGRSNVGKSSFVNALAQRKRLARTSNQPGCTQTINFYRVGQLTVVDLPGYGYAKASQSQRKAWRRLMQGYLRQRQAIRAVLQFVDCRHDPMESDLDMHSWLSSQGLRTWVIATKSDKLTRHRLEQQVQKMTQAFQCPVIAFSSVTKQGRTGVMALLKELLTEYAG